MLIINTMRSPNSPDQHCSYYQLCFVSTSSLHSTWHNITQLTSRVQLPNFRFSLKQRDSSIYNLYPWIYYWAHEHGSWTQECYGWSKSDAIFLYQCIYVPTGWISLRIPNYTLKFWTTLNSHIIVGHNISREPTLIPIMRIYVGHMNFQHMLNS